MTEPTFVPTSIIWLTDDWTLTWSALRPDFHSCLVSPVSVCTSLSLTTLSASKSSFPHHLSLSLSLPPFLPSYPAEKTRRAEIILFVCVYAWSKEKTKSPFAPSLCVKYTSQGSHPWGRMNTEEWFHRLCTPIAHFPLLLLLQVEGQRLREEEEEPVEGSVAFPSLTSSPEPPTSVTHVKDSAAARLQWINWIDLKLMIFNPDTLQCFPTLLDLV